MSLITNFIFNSIYTIYNYIIPDITCIINKQSKKNVKSLKDIIKESLLEQSSNNNSAQVKEIGENEEYKEIEHLTREYRLKKIRPNTTNDLYNYKNNMINISKSEENILDSEKIFWICFNCKRKIPYYRDLYCSNDKIFCSFNCRDDFLINKINKINNNI